ncbi:two-component system chemotaxis response regulator CheV [Ammoniphilus resinae]|uniref:Two-component system chemotaxis response regulator CheV n=2 Tax=Ammoniphilus resinae TaxID=861532 RepID=A0ABS4GWQ3_9BACL|nr:two-component system chemotaxis response regulator CheV [Ammoniphilus resinae]
MKEENISHEILLESGTNELEVLELGIGKDQCLGVNVAKVREITAASSVTKIPHSHPYLEGIIQLRNEVLPVVHLGRALGIPTELKEGEGIFVITEFNQTKVIFHVEWVNQIHRISWGAIEKVTGMMEQTASSVVGVIKFEDKMILLVDYEKILTDINPDIGVSLKRAERVGNKAERNKKGILIAEDSPMLRMLISETLNTAGYTQLKIFDNGKELWDFLNDGYQEEQLFHHYHLVITDIEMPQMDGLHLTKRVKEHPDLKQLPVVIFSSLVSDALKHKGDIVGADAQVGKPQIDTLVETLDRLIL